MADTVIFLNACFTYMPSPELGNFLLARLLRRKGNIRLRRRFGRLPKGQWQSQSHGVPAKARSHILYDKPVHHEHHCQKPSRAKGMKAKQIWLNQYVS
jgi:hypothetical protein